MRNIETEIEWQHIRIGFCFFINEFRCFRIHNIASLSVLSGVNQTSYDSFLIRNLTDRKYLLCFIILVLDIQYVIKKGLSDIKKISVVIIEIIDVLIGVRAAFETHSDGVHS